jgi:Protein of unknown function (DUF3631)
MDFTTARRTTGGPYAVADAISGVWPEQARAIAASTIKDDSNGNESFGVQLLRDVRKVLGTFEQMELNEAESVSH